MNRMNAKPAGEESEPRVPADLRKALAAAPMARVQWSDLTPIARRDFISWIDSAKQPETRRRRIERAFFPMKPDGSQLQRLSSAQHDLRHQRRRLQACERAKQGLDRIEFRHRARTDMMVQANLVRHSAHDEDVR